jgi:DHA1 family tetracycline resistance protein-like MFS transporter
MLALIFIANGFAYAFFVITLPIIGRQLDFSDTNTSLILGMSAFMITLVSPIWGRLCERWGRKKVILISIVATLFCTILTAFIIKLRIELAISLQLSFLLLLSVRILNSLFTGGIKPAGQAYIADTTHINMRAKGMGLMGAAFGMGSILGGLCAVIFGSNNIFFGYVAVSITLLISFFLAYQQLPESRPTDAYPVSRTPLPYSKIWIFLTITLVGLSVFSLLQHTISLTLADKFALSDDLTIRTSGMSMMVMMVTMIITQALLLRVLSLTPIMLILLGIVCSSAALLFASLVPVLWGFIVSMILFGFGLGLLFPGNLALLSINVDSFSQGRIAGVNGMAQGVGLALGPILGSYLHHSVVSFPYVHAYALPYLSSAFLLFILIVPLALLRYRSLSTCKND